MKSQVFFVAVACFFLTSVKASDKFQLLIEPVWHNLEKNEIHAKKFGGKWIVVGSITFKKKAKEAVHLHKLYLRWKGKPLERLLGSLYRKNPEKDFLPVQEQLVCDGSWNKVQQTLRLTFDHKENLGISNMFYLVLTVPEDIEHVVKKGSFEIVQKTLPEQFRAAPSKDLSLTLDILGSTCHSDTADF